MSCQLKIAQSNQLLQPMFLEREERLVLPSKVNKIVGSVTVLYGSLSCLAWNFLMLLKQDLSNSSAIP